VGDRSVPQAIRVSYKSAARAGRLGPMPTTIDIHAHFVSRELIGEAERNGARYGVQLDRDSNGSERIVFANGTRLRPFFPELCDLPVRLPTLQSMSIDRQLISTWTDMSGDLLAVPEAARWARLQNETLRDAAAQHPDTFEAMGTLPLQDVSASIEELQHIVGNLGMRSIELSTNLNGRDLDGPEYHPLWKRIRDLDVFVLLHPGFVTVSPQRLDTYFLNNLVGFPTDTTIAAARLIFSGIVQKLPGLKCCLAHGGGFLPYQIGRLDRGFNVHPACSASLSASPSKLMRAFYFDTLTHDDAALRFLFDAVDREKIVYGSDYPFEMLDEAGPKRVSRVSGLSQAEVLAALGGNAERALHSSMACRSKLQLTAGE
jgi:aminocarboxymuconate-semialdehyde decarboxylase